jgi:hypothetical protein
MLHQQAAAYHVPAVKEGAMVLLSSTSHVLQHAKP